MNVLQVTGSDILGRRFNGFDLNEGLQKNGIFTEQLVFQKDSALSTVHVIPDMPRLREELVNFEHRHALQLLALPYGKLMMQSPAFQRSDIVHYHLIHNNMLSLLDLPAMTHAKPAVWSWHDPWPVTGHCVHPKSCNGWKTGCAPCSHLMEYFPLRRDTAGFLWDVKRQVYPQMDVDIVVASKFMLRFAQESPLGQCFPRVHLIPFGIQAEAFQQRTMAQARQALNIPSNHFVIAFRCETDEFKGVDYIYRMLERLNDRAGVSIVTVGFGTLPKRIKDKYHTVELGWQNNPDLIMSFYTACNVFLMPSIAESFGLMAAEAMVCSRPVVCFEGTALPDVTFAPDCGIAVPRGDVEQLLQAVVRLREHPEESEARGRLGRRLAEAHYRFEDYVQRHEALYQDILSRRRAKKHGS